MSGTSSSAQSRFSDGRLDGPKRSSAATCTLVGDGDASRGEGGEAGEGEGEERFSWGGEETRVS